MAFFFADRTMDTSTTAGTGNMVVSGTAPVGWKTFSAACPVGTQFYYTIVDSISGAWETGEGTYSALNTVSRDVVRESSAANARITFAGNIKNVFIDTIAHTFNHDFVAALVGTVTPQMYGANPNTGIVTAAFQAAMTAAAGRTLEVSAGVWGLDANIQIPANITINMHPGAILDFTLAVPGTIGMTAQGTLGPIVYLTQDSYALGPATIWEGSTTSVPVNYAVDDRVSYQGICWRCVTAHTASKPTDFNVTAAAMYHDAITLGLWQRTTFKPTGGLNGIGVNDWFIVQDNMPYDVIGLSTFRGEVVRALEVNSSTGIITSQGTLHYDYLVSRNAFVRKLTPLDNIRIYGGHMKFRTDVSINNSTGLMFICCSNVKVVGLEAEALVACVSVQDTVNFESTGCYFHDGRGLAYGWAVSNNCAHVNIHHNATTQCRHAITVSASPNRSGPMHVKFIGNHVDYSLRYTPGATSPFGGTGDAVDTHAGCDYVEFSGNTILNASGSGIHVEAAHAVVRNNIIDGAYYGMTIGNNTSVVGSMDITGNTLFRCNSTGFSVRSNAAGATYSYINVSDNAVDDVAGLAYYIAGMSNKRLGGLTFIGNRASNSKSGGYLALLTFCDSPTISGYAARPSQISQSALCLMNFVGGQITSMTAVYPVGATAIALMLSNGNTEFVRAGRVSNVGNGTITVPADPLRPGYQEGIYKVRCTTTAPNGGTFTFLGIDGVAIGTVLVGATWDVYINFTINDGTVDYALNDGWDFTVSGSSVVTSKTSNNVGGATLTVPDNTVLDDNVQEGTYLVTCTSAALPATWAVTRPDTTSHGTATTGVPFNVAGLRFTITAAGAASAVSDTFTLAATSAGRDMQISGVNLVSPSPGTNRGFFFGAEGTTKRCFWSADNDVSQANGNGTFTTGFGHNVQSKDRVEVRSENTSMSWTQLAKPTTAICSAPTVILTGAITANRTMTMTTLGVTDGCSVVFKNQSGVTAFSWSIGGLVTIINGKWAQVTYSEALGAWVMTMTG